MTRLVRDSNGYVVQTLRQGAVSNIAVSGAAAASSAFAEGATVRLASDVDCWYLITTAGTDASSSNGSYLPAKAIDYPHIGKNFVLSVIGNGSDNGTLNITQGG